MSYRKYKMLKFNNLFNIALVCTLVLASQVGFTDVKLQSKQVKFSPQFEQNFFPKFAQCDISFFQWLKRNKSQLDGVVSLIDKNGSTVFAVVKQNLVDEYDGETLERIKEYGNEKFYSIQFKQPITVNGVQLTGYYFQEKDPELFFENDYQKGMKAYFWGFTTNEPTLQRIIRKLYQLKFTGEDNVRMASTYLIADVRKSSKWVATNLGFGVAPKPNTVEKNVFVSGSSSPTIECSIQGVVSPNLLKTLHPAVD